MKGLHDTNKIIFKILCCLKSLEEAQLCNIPDVQTGKGGQEDATEEGEGHGEQQGEASVRPHTDLLEADHAVEPHLVDAARGGGLSQHVTHLYLQAGNVRIHGPN